MYGIIACVLWCSSAMFTYMHQLSCCSLDEYRSTLWSWYDVAQRFTSSFTTGFPSLRDPIRRVKVFLELLFGSGNWNLKLSWFAPETRLTFSNTVLSEIFARVLFSLNFAVDVGPRKLSARNFLLMRKIWSRGIHYHLDAVKVFLELLFSARAMTLVGVAIEIWNWVD